MNFIHGPEQRHHPVDLECVAMVKHFVRTDNYEHSITFYTKYGKELAAWYFPVKEKELVKLTFENIKNELGSKNINDTVKL